MQGRPEGEGVPDSVVEGLLEALGGGVEEDAAAGGGWRGGGWAGARLGGHGG